MVSTSFTESFPAIGATSTGSGVTVPPGIMISPVLVLWGVTNSSFGFVSSTVSVSEPRLNEFRGSGSTVAEH